MTDSATKTRAPRLRADATRNRERILAAAQEAFVEFGPDVPLDDIARRAGVGNATLYRHFPDRQELSRAVVLDVFATMTTHAEAALAGEATAFEALTQMVHGAVEWNVGALCPMLAEWMDLGEPTLLVAQDRLDNVVEAIIEKAQAEGTLRKDIGPGDIFPVVAQIARPLPGSPPLDHGTQAHRSLQLFLDGLRAPGHSVLVGSPTTMQDLRRAWPGSLKN
jgi:AcrR family transcriptional regulator